MTPRGSFQGVGTIVWFNWPFYAVAGLAISIAAVSAAFLPYPGLRFFAWTAAAGMALLTFGSLCVSHLIYDRSDLYRWQWLDRALAAAGTGRMVVCHTGYDEVSAALAERFPHADWTVLDHYDPDRMTEASIRRARRACPPSAGSIAAPFADWPLEAGEADVIFGLLAIHELRSEEERAAWFSEAGRCLASGGRIVLVEHVRDWANFLAFGPGFLHFHSPRSWRKCWEAAGFRLEDTFRVTPWVRVFVICRR